MLKLLTLTSAALLAISTPAFAMTADFEVGNTQGWIQGAGQFGGNAPPPVVVMNAGPNGGIFSLQTMPGSNNHLFPHTVSNVDFTGDFISAGIVQVEFDAMAPLSNLTANIELHAIVMNVQSQWVSLGSTMIPPDGAWDHYVISLAEVDMNPGANAYATDFSSVTRFGLRHQTGSGGSTPLASANDSVFLDNITVPEPAAASLWMAALLALGSLVGFKRRA